MPFESQRDFRTGDAAAVILDHDPVNASRRKLYGDAAGPCIHGVFDQFLHCAGRALDHVDYRPGKTELSAAPMRILADLAGAGGEAFEIAPADDPDDLAALDAAWEEEQVRFDGPAAPGAADCPQVAGMVDRMLAQEPVRSQIHG